MKKKYIKPMAWVISVVQPLCSNGLDNASVRRLNGDYVDNFDVVEEEESKDKYNWDTNAWGGN